MESRRNGPQLSSRHDDDDDEWLLGAVLIMLILVVTYIVDWNSFIHVGLFCALCLVYLLF